MSCRGEDMAADAESQTTALPVKLEVVEDFVEEEDGPLNKRSKPSSDFDLEQQWGDGANAFPIPPSDYSPLDEPSPLGLRLKKSPSLLDLIQMRISQSVPPTLVASKGESHGTRVVKETKSSSRTGDRLKASNFPASHLRIGQWEYKSRYEGDLVAKCYFAKCKLVWEILEGGLKNKIEIQWTDIFAMKANCPDNEPCTLDIVLARPPLFFRETNPQPRKHTLWQPTADFTDGQASIHRQHFLQCKQGLLKKHFEKLIQCDKRLNLLSQQPEIVLDSPYFEARVSTLEDPEVSEGHHPENDENVKGFTISTYQGSPTAESSSLTAELPDQSCDSSKDVPQEGSPSSGVMNIGGTEEYQGVKMVATWESRSGETIRVAGPHTCRPISDIMSHIEQSLNKEITSPHPSSASGLGCQDLLENIRQCLFNDTQITTASDEKYLISRVDSLCCLLQKDANPDQNLHASGNSCDEQSSDAMILQPNEESIDSTDGCKSLAYTIPKGDPKKDSKCKQPAGMSRKDSYGDLLHHLPRIASLPKFLFHISEED